MTSTKWLAYSSPMGATKPMPKKRPHEQRMADISHSVVPLRLRQDPILSAIAERNMRMDIAARQRLKQLESKINLLAYATWASSSGLRIANELRRFWLEYFERWLRYGPESLPSSFNVLEAFMNFDEELNTFKLRSEKEHILSFGYYLDWYTAGSFPEEPGALIDIMQEGVIHSYDFVLSADQPLLSAGTSKLAVASAALVRHQDELSILLLAGETPPLDALDPNGIPAVGKSDLRPAADLTPESRLLEGATDFSRVILATRFNLTNRSGDVRYLLFDRGCLYNIATDDFETIGRSLSMGRTSQDYISLKEEHLAELARYSDLFSATAALMYLPAFFISRAQECNDTEFLTAMGVEAKEPKVKRLRRELGEIYFKPRRTIRCMPAPTARPARLSFIVQPPELEFESQGFWKPLPIGQIGSAPDGTAIVGKTWVQRTESWQSTSPAEFLARRAHEPLPSSEFIYITRTPSHVADLYKVGMTTRDVLTRIGELTGSTSTPLPFEALAQWAVEDAAALEEEIHRALAEYRVSPRREFFRAPLSTIILTINRVLDRCGQYSS